MTQVSSAQAYFRTAHYEEFIDHLRPLLNREITIKNYEIELVLQDFSQTTPHLVTARKVVNLTKELTDPIPTSIDAFRDLLLHEISQIPPKGEAFAEELQKLLEKIENPATAAIAFSAFCASAERAREDGGFGHMVRDCEESFRAPDQLSRRVTVEYGPPEGEQRLAIFSAEA